jgi:hypothetical protein
MALMAVVPAVAPRALTLAAMAVAPLTSAANPLNWPIVYSWPVVVAVPVPAFQHARLRHMISLRILS